MKKQDNLRIKNKLKVYTILILFLIGVNFNLFAQEEKEAEKNNVNEKTHQFGFTIKRANYAYYPAEHTAEPPLFSSLTNRDRFSSLYPYYNRGYNICRVTNPFSLLYYNKTLNLNFEFSHYDLQINSPHFYAYFTEPLPSSLIPTYDTEAIRRSENKVNIYSSFNLNENNSLFYGLGIRNIKKENYQRKGLSQNTIVDTTYGINLFLKYRYTIFSNLSVNFSLEPFYTYGSRDFKRDYIQYLIDPSDFRIRYNDPHAKVYFYGGEFDINLSFKFYENLQLIVGYGFIYTKIRYQNDNNRNLTIYKDYTRHFYTPYLQSTDHINNYYIGLNAKF